MKTAEQWADIWLDSGYRNSRIALTEHIKEIQLDSWKQGMMEAAAIAIGEAERYRSEIPNLVTTHIPAEELVYACNKVVLKIDLACQAKKDLE